MAVRASISTETFPLVTPVLGQLIDYSWALEGLASNFTELAQAYVPVRTGYLQSTINAYSTGFSVECEAGADYAQYVEYGTVYQAPQPYFEPALEEAISSSIDEFFIAGANALEGEWDYVQTVAQAELDAAQSECDSKVAEGERLIQEGEQEIQEGQELIEEGQDMLHDWDFTNDEEAINMIEEGTRMVLEGIEISEMGIEIVDTAIIEFLIIQIEIEVYLAECESLELMCAEEIELAAGSLSAFVGIE